MDLLEEYNTPENHEAAKRLLKKVADPAHADEMDEAFYDFFATVFLCELCDSMGDGLDMTETMDRLNAYYEDETEDSFIALASGLRHSRLAYITGADGKIKAGAMDLMTEDGGVEEIEAVPLFLWKEKSNRWMEPGDVMHMTGFSNIMKLCAKAGQDLFLIDPSPIAIGIGTDDIKTCFVHLDTAGEVIRKLKNYGLATEDLFPPLLMSFDGCPVRCVADGGTLDGIAYITAGTKPMVTIRDFHSNLAVTMPLGKVHSLQEFKVT